MLVCGDDQSTGGLLRRPVPRRRRDRPADGVGVLAGGPGVVICTIVGYHQDDAGDWVAELSCLHNQHVRHRPPFQERAWVTTTEGRASHVGSAIECPLCDRGEPPARER